jgi:hypothetical protein
LLIEAIVILLAVGRLAFATSVRKGDSHGAL